MNKKFLLISTAVAAGTPLAAFAQDTTAIENYIDVFLGFLDTLPPLFLTVAVVFTLWGIVRFVAAGDNDEMRAKGKKTMLWGVVGIVLMVSLWGIINIVNDTLFDGTDQTSVDPIELN